MSVLRNPLPRREQRRMDFEPGEVSDSASSAAPLGAHPEGGGESAVAGEQTQQPGGGGAADGAGAMSEELDEETLRQQGLSKVVIVDDQNQPTGVAYVTQEQANQIAAGLLQIQFTPDNQVSSLFSCIFRQHSLFILHFYYDLFSTAF